MILNYEYPPLGGGAANATKYILKEFSRHKNIEIDLITSSVDKFKIEKISDNITIHYLNINKNPNKLHSQSKRDLIVYSTKAYLYAKKLMSQERYDLCHAFFGIPCGFIVRNLGIPYIVSLRGSDVPFYSEKYRLLDKFFFKRLSRKIWKQADYVIANSYLLKNLALQSSPDQEIEVISNGIDTNEFMKKEKYNKGKKLKILCVGRLIERKGFAYVIDSIKPLGEKVSLSIIGDGPLREELELQSQNLDVKFLGVVNHDELSELYKEYDLFILPSFNEGMSNTALEAMAAGLPLLMTDTGGTAELIDGNGFIIKTADSNDITSKINEYITNKDLLEIHGTKSRELAEKMAWETVSQEYFKIYKEITLRIRLLSVSQSVSHTASKTSEHSTEHSSN